MPCAMVTFLVWTVREWFASDRSLRALAPLELAWMERDLAVAWPACALFLSILDCERTRELAIAPSGDGGRSMTLDEARIVAGLTVARCGPSPAFRWFRGFLDADSAGAAARAAAHLQRMMIGDQSRRPAVLTY